MTVQYSAIPTGKGDISETQFKEFVNRIASALYWISPVLNKSLGQAEPPTAYKRDGALAYADGTSWNPNGTGKGLYRYNSATSLWVLVG